jgi:hypothetical protein
MRQNTVLGLGAKYAFASLLLIACTKKTLTETQSASDSELTVSALSAGNLASATATSEGANLLGEGSYATRIEAEDYTTMSGVKNEITNDDGGGENVGFIDYGDWMDYSYNAASASTYSLNLRVATNNKAQLQIKKTDGTLLLTVNIPNTGNYQTYQTISATITLPQGAQTIRVQSSSTAHWNINWFELVGSQAPATPSPSPSSTPGRNNLILESTFEDASGFNKWTKEICRPDALTISTTAARQGSSSARFEFTKADVAKYNHYLRAEIQVGSNPADELWYGFSNLLTNDFIIDPAPDVVAQWHDAPDWNLGENWRSPPISMEVYNGRYRLKVMWASKAVNTNDTKDGETYFDLGPVNNNNWNDWVFHIKFSYSSDGILEVWKNRQKLVSHYGPNSYNDKTHPYFKIGIYKWGWNALSNYSTGEKRVLFYDDVRIANKNANLDEVSPR